MRKNKEEERPTLKRHLQALSDDYDGTIIDTVRIVHDIMAAKSKLVRFKEAVERHERQVRAMKTEVPALTVKPEHQSSSNWEYIFRIASIESDVNP